MFPVQPIYLWISFSLQLNKFPLSIITHFHDLFISRLTSWLFLYPSNCEQNSYEHMLACVSQVGSRVLWMPKSDIVRSYGRSVSIVTAPAHTAPTMNVIATHINCKQLTGAKAGWSLWAQGHPGLHGHAHMEVIEQLAVVSSHILPCESGSWSQIVRIRYKCICLPSHFIGLSHPNFDLYT